MKPTGSSRPTQSQVRLDRHEFGGPESDVCVAAVRALDRSLLCRIRRAECRIRISIVGGLRANGVSLRSRRLAAGDVVPVGSVAGMRREVRVAWLPAALSCPSVGTITLRHFVGPSASSDETPSGNASCGVLATLVPFLRLGWVSAPPNGTTPGTAPVDPDDVLDAGPRFRRRRDDVSTTKESPPGEPDERVRRADDEDDSTVRRRRMPCPSTAAPPERDGSAPTRPMYRHIPRSVAFPGARRRGTRPAGLGGCFACPAV